jgi:hypothetical protein
LPLANLPGVEALNQITPDIPVALIAGISAVAHNLDCRPTDEMPFQTQEKEIDALRDEIERLTQQNDDLKQVIDSVYASPGEKRELLAQLESKYKISRRRACRLLSFARSTCWYRSQAGPTFLNSDQPDITSLSNSALVQRLKKLARRAENGFLPLDENLQTQFEYGLNKIGLAGAAHLSQSNLKLAMEIFSAWCQQARK